MGKKMTAIVETTIVETITIENKLSEKNDHFRGQKMSDRFFRYSGRLLYFHMPFVSLNWIAEDPDNLWALSKKIGKKSMVYVLEKQPFVHNALKRLHFRASFKLAMGKKS